MLVPLIVWAIASNQMEIAFAIFVVAGVSDAVDGFLAKRFNMASELGALLDPLADKAPLVYFSNRDEALNWIHERRAALDAANTD